MTATVCALRPTQTSRKRRKAPLQAGDVWVLIGPTTLVSIVSVFPRPTSQKPDAQAVTLSDGRTIAESTFRGSYMRRHEYETVFMPELRAKLRVAFAELSNTRADVIPLRRGAA